MAWLRKAMRVLFDTDATAAAGASAGRSSRPAKRRVGDARAPSPTRASTPTDERRRPPAPKPLTEERKALIREALRIHRAKRGILEELGEEDRFLLKVMAHQILVEEPRASSQNAEVREPERTEKPRRDGKT